MSLTVRKFITEKFNQNCYVLYNSNVGIIIDPGDDFEQVGYFIDQHNIEIKAVLSTHGHFDHIGSVAHFQKIYNAPYYLHSKDKRLLSHANFYRSLSGLTDTSEIPEIDNYLDDYEILEFSIIKLKLIETPGHTTGSICFHINDLLFTGDTLLKNDLGRTDLPGSKPKSLQHSLGKLISFPEETMLLPGHGESTTIAQELINNNKLKSLIHEH